MNQKKFYHALALAFEGDRLKLAKLRKKFISWEEAYRYLRQRITGISDIERSWAALNTAHIRLIFLEEPEYPPLLREIKDPPIALYIRGRLPEVGPPQNNPYLAAVGTRRATPEGIALMRRFAGTLAQNGFIIVSGLAFGIDAAAHEGCLERGGTTIAVLAGGLDRVYPRNHAKLAEKILRENGAIVSEYPPGAPPYRDRFLERNRIIAGISRGVLIGEAPEKSGALVTARLALEENRDVFAIPGPVTHENYRGPHALIRQGAELVTAPEEILAAYGIVREPRHAGAFTGASSEEKQVLEALYAAATPLEVDKIAAAAKLEPRIANCTLAFLVTKDLVRETESGYTINKLL